MSQIPSKFGEGQRRRRTHSKSRRGCRNCKLRRVKCDEAKPQCQKCVQFGLACNYNLSIDSDLQLAREETHKIHLETPAGHIVFNTNPLDTFMQPAVLIGDGRDSFQLGREGLARLSRFQSHTAYTFATTRSTEVHTNEVLKIAIENPFLMHIIQVVTAMHDRTLNNSSDNVKQSLTETYHWSRAAALLNQKLSFPIRPQDRDSLWASAGMIGVASFASLEAATPEEAWPLKPAESSDLTWLHLFDGKMALWEATDPLRPDSIFHSTAAEYAMIKAEPPSLEVEKIPSGFVELYCLDEPLACDHNPYYYAVSVLSGLLPIKCTQARMSNYLGFMDAMTPSFKYLLDEKDARALLLMAYWYGGMCESLWWVSRRSRLECQAICLYLEKYHAEEGDILNMLTLPRIQCGLAS